jgi:TolA-binding protein
VPASWPQHDKAPDALLGQANSLRDSGDIKGARATLEQIVEKYPNSNAAQAARPRLQK